MAHVRAAAAAAAAAATLAALACTALQGAHARMAVWSSRAVDSRHVPAGAVHRLTINLSAPLCPRSLSSRYWIIFACLTMVENVFIPSISGVCQRAARKQQQQRARANPRATCRAQGSGFLSIVYCAAKIGFLEWAANDSTRGAEARACVAAYRSASLALTPRTHGPQSLYRSFVAPSLQKLERTVEPEPAGGAQRSASPKSK